jgi:autoinducer 2-degrading protein
LTIEPGVYIIRETPRVVARRLRMHVVLVHVHVKPGNVGDFIEATLANARDSVKEPGNRRFDVLQLADDPCRFVLYEAYASAVDAAAHKETPHYKAWKDTVADWMAEPRSGVRYEALGG